MAGVHGPMLGAVSKAREDIESCWSFVPRRQMMDTAVEVSYDVVGMLFGPDSLLPWWAWLAPLAMIFLKLLSPVLVPEVAEAQRGSGGGGKQVKSGKKGKKAAKKK
jgi:hypothetical protein